MNTVSVSGGNDASHKGTTPNTASCSAKGAMYYAAGLMHMTQAILRNQNTVLSVNSLMTGNYGMNDVRFSLPTIVNCTGVQQALRVELSDEELTKLQHSAGALQQTISKLGL